MSNNEDEIHVFPQEASTDPDSNLRIVEVREEPGNPGSLPKKYGRLPDGTWVQLTAAGVPRKKPGRKPGTIIKPRTSDVATDSNGEQKQRKPRKPRDPNAPSRKRKIAATEDDGNGSDAPASSLNAVTSHPHTTNPSPTPYGQNLTPHGSPGAGSQRDQTTHLQSEQHFSPSVVKRENYPSSMQNILNADPPSYLSGRTGGQSYDPIRGNYDPVRETMTTGSPRAPAYQLPNKSPSIASLIEPVQNATVSPHRSTPVAQPADSATAARVAHSMESGSHPPSPSRSVKPDVAVEEPKKDPKERIVIKESNFTTIANGPVKKPSPALKANKTGISTPKTDNLDDLPMENEGRSILDFGKARPGEELKAPNIVLDIPIIPGETNKYVNVMRMAEDKYGWDALYPRQAADRDRRARIAAVTASLEKVDSGNGSGDEASDDQSDAEASNPDNGGTSGPDAQAKPKKKRTFKEDQYDVGDDFVDDSEMLWEAQAAASQDGFFVYSGPLVPEPEPSKEERMERPKRGRGSRGGRMGPTRGTGTGRGGGPGSRGGIGSRGGSITRKPRITKSEKAQREREKAEREAMAQVGRTPTSNYVLQPATSAVAVSEVS